MPPLRVALFVEGSSAPPPPRGLAPLDRIWNEHLAGELGFEPFTPIVPISKKHLVAMDPDAPPMSGAGEPLDLLMARWLERAPFDAAVVAWDLVPAWNPAEDFCRWQETLDLYRYLADSSALPVPWTTAARQRHVELSSRPAPDARAGPRRLRRNEVLALCMEPMFEGLLVRGEQAVRRALNLEGHPSPRGWPRASWGPPPPRHPDSTLLAPAIRSLRTLRPRPALTRRVVGDFRTNKDGWGEYLLRRLLADDEARCDVMAHPLCVRLREWLG